MLVQDRAGDTGTLVDGGRMVTWGVSKDTRCDAFKSNYCGIFSPRLEYAGRKHMAPRDGTVESFKADRTIRQRLFGMAARSSCSTATLGVKKEKVHLSDVLVLNVKTWKWHRASYSDGTSKGTVPNLPQARSGMRRLTFE